MKKTSLYLTDQQAARLRRLSAAQGRSQADVLRAALDSYAEARPERRLLCVAVADGPGDDVASIPEEELLEGFGES